VSLNVFYLIAIVIVVVAPLIVPVVATAYHGIRDMRQRAGGFRPAFAPAFAGAVPAAA
jgi:hypothetical protein